MDVELQRERHRKAQASYRERHWDRVLEQQRANYAKNPERHARKHLKRKYGLTTERCDALLLEQDGVCEICGRPSEVGRRLVVDHDHVTGKVRGLLCKGCNAAIGYMENIPRFFEVASHYLARAEN